MLHEWKTRLRKYPVTAAHCRLFVSAVKALFLQGLSAAQEFLSEYVQGRLSAPGGAGNNNSPL